MNPTLLRVLGPGAALVVPVACSPPDVVKPLAPDMSELVQSYEAPTGLLDPADAAALAAGVSLVSQALARTEIAPRLLELLGELIEPVTASGADQADADDPLQLTVRADGYVELTRICPGWTSPFMVDERNGLLRATATFSEKGLDPVAWGTVAACRYLVADTQVELTPRAEDRDSLRVYWGEAVNRETLAARNLVFSLDLSAVVDGATFDLGVDFRVVEAGAIEYLVPVDSGYLVVRANEDGTFVLRSRDGSFTCAADLDCELEPLDEN